MLHWKEAVGYVSASLGIFAATLAAAPFRSIIELSNVALIYVLAVVVIGVRRGRGPAVFSAILGSLTFAHVFVPPYFSLAITEAHYVLTAVIMLAVALIVGHLTSALKRHAELAEARSLRTRALYDFARELTGAMTPASVIDITSRFLAHSLNAKETQVIFPDSFSDPARPASPALTKECIERKSLLSIQKNKECSYVLAPLQAAGGIQGILLFEARSAILEEQELRGYIETMASVVAVALERSHYAEVARETEVKHAAESLRSSILSALSHDLRTPLTALVGMADTLLLGKASPERQKHILESIRSQALAISQQTSNLLDMARLRSGAITLNKAWQPVEEVIGATLQLVRYQWKDREITVDIAPNLPPLSLDAVLMERVLWNLLENAIKYSPAESPVELAVRRAETSIDISVCDWGPGLPTGNSEELFGIFRRGHAESDIPGVGLGLAIARTIVDAHGGAISASNRSGGGACFRVRLPIGDLPNLTGLEELA